MTNHLDINNKSDKKLKIYKIENIIGMKKIFFFSQEEKRLNSVEIFLSYLITDGHIY